MTMNSTLVPPVFKVAPLKRLTGLAAWVMTGGLTLLGCAAAPTPTSAEANGRIMKIGGEGYVVRQLTAGTWTATPQTTKRTRQLALAEAATSDAHDKAAAEQAIESASGCKVTDSYFSLSGEQLDAQVACPGLSN